MTVERDNRSRVLEIRSSLGGPDYRTLFASVRRRFEETGSRPKSVTLRDLDEPERRALADLYGWKVLPRATVRIDLERLDRTLQASRFRTGLQGVIEILGGPVTDRKALRRREQAAREELWERARAHPAVRAMPALRIWLDDIRSLGLLPRAARAAGMEESSLLNLALGLLSRLPAEGLLLSVLAAEVTGDAHALDPGKPVAGIVLRAVMRLVGLEELPSTSSERRALWNRVGVLCDPLSSHVLVVGLSPGGGSRLSGCLREASNAGEPVRITLRELERHSLSVPTGMRVHVCENPAVVATAADRLAGACPPLVCTDGVPSVAVWALLKTLRRGGAKICFHCDFDWGGIRIGEQLVERVSAIPWMFTCEEYERNVQEGLDLPALTGPPSAASWDPGLTRAMQRSGRALLEEHVIDALLEDLSSRA